jgi:hypothetical protein
MAATLPAGRDQRSYMVRIIFDSLQARHEADQPQQYRTRKGFRISECIENIEKENSKE